MKNKSLFVKILCAFLAVSMMSMSVFAADGAAPAAPAADTAAAADAAGTPKAAPEDVNLSSQEKKQAAYKKSETVYVNLNPDGTPREQIVSNWLHSDTAGATISDRTTLKEIENVKGEEQPERKGNDLTWKLDGNDLYYRGKADGQLPVSIDITYRLDGKKMSPEEMAGKSGHVEIEMRFKNNLSQKVKVGEKTITMYTPMMAAAALSFPSSSFSNVTVSDGTVQTDGSNQAVAIVAMPGLNESIGLTDYDLPGFEMDGLDFPSSFTISADCTEFTMGPVGVVVSGGISGLDELGTAQDIDEMRADLYDLKGAQSDLSAWDPSHRIRSLFSTPQLVSGAQVLVEDIFRFYDIDTAMFDILPDYITDENIKLMDRVSDDLDAVDIDKLLDSDAVDDLIDAMTKKNIDNLRKLLADYDTIRQLDSEELSSLVEQSIDLLDALEKYQEQVQTIRVLTGYADDMMALCTAIKNSGLLDMATDENIGAAVGGIASNAGNKQIKPLLEKVEALRSGIESAPEDETLENFGLSDSYMALMNQLAPDAAAQLSPLMNLPLKMDIAVAEALAQGITIGDEVYPSGDTVKKKLLEALDTVRERIKEAAQEQINQGTQDTMQSIAGLKKEIERLEGGLMQGLGVSSTEAMKAKLEQAASFTEQMIVPLQRMMATAEKLSDNLRHSPDSGKLQYLLEETDDMLADLRANEETIEAMRRLLDEYDSDDMESLRVHYNDLRHDLKDVKPILQALRDDLGDPVLDQSLHSSPESVDVLLKMKDDLYANREVSEILREAVAPDRVAIASGMFDTFDRLEEKGSVDKYVGQVDDVDELLARKDAYVGLSDSYRLYTDAADDAETSVKFIMKTDEVKKPEPEPEEAVEVPEQGFKGWLQRIIAKIKK